MLTSNDLAIVCAALQFLDEEFSPEDDDLLQCYLNDEGVLAGLTTNHIKETRAKFDAARLYLAVKRVDRDELVSTNLFRLPTDNDLSYQVDREQMVAVIVPR